MCLLWFYMERHLLSHKHIKGSVSTQMNEIFFYMFFLFFLFFLLLNISFLIWCTEIAGNKQCSGAKVVEKITCSHLLDYERCVSISQGLRSFSSHFTFAQLQCVRVTECTGDYETQLVFFYSITFKVDISGKIEKHFQWLWSFRKLFFNK